MAFYLSKKQKKKKTVIENVNHETNIHLQIIIACVMFENTSSSTNKT